VIDMYGVGNDLAPVPDNEIDSIRRTVNFPLLLEPCPDLMPGQQVKIHSGPLEGLAGTLIENRKGLRLLISVEFLHRSVLVEIDGEWVVPLEPLKTAMRATSCTFDPAGLTRVMEEER
jgi:transcription antitermination factor NusG